MSGTDGLHDEAGNALDGDNDTNAGGPYVRTFGVQLAPTIPTIDLTGATTVDEGAIYTLTLGAVTDLGGVTVTEYRVHWGDGQSDTYFADGAVTHVYADGLATPTISVDLVDADGIHVNAGSLNLTVENLSPTISISGPSTVDEDSLLHAYPRNRY